MKKTLIIVLLIILLVIIVAAVYKITNKNKSSNISVTPSAQPSSVAPSFLLVASTPPSVTPSESPSISKYGLNYPIEQFKERITKKPFGIYITPDTSPVQPERFAGYHTGADVEFQDAESDVPVFAVNDGKVVFSDTVSGYGGVIMLEIDLNGSKHTVLYGHIRPSSLPNLGSNVNKGDQIGLLGTGYSTETDGERRHLHFAILSDDRIDVLGYVQTQDALSGWYNPLDYYN
jgi:murein DD-endopeptidase MepM/ murein hydrolase activator NlpD